MSSSDEEDDLYEQMLLRAKRRPPAAVDPVDRNGTPGEVAEGVGDDDAEAGIRLLERAMTPAQRQAYERQLERERAAVRVEATKSHREVVEEYNARLARAPEHFDLPKVGPG